MTSLNPINFKDGHKYFTDLEDLNDQLGEINSDCKLTEMQLEVKAFNSIYNPRENKVTSWSQFRNNMSKGDKLSSRTYTEFKDDCTQYWANNGNPGNPSKREQAKALNITERKCYKCNEFGHIAANCLKCENKGYGNYQKKNFSNNKKKKFNKKEVKCYNCGGIGHFAYQCKKPKNKNRNNKGNSNKFNK
ncbi:hypothetical protein ACA910_001692 [Epithemia clementina (nom. ined.)]